MAQNLYRCSAPKCPANGELQEHPYTPEQWTARGEIGPVICHKCGHPVTFVQAGAA